MKILSVNAGSSSLKFTLFLMPEGKELINGYFEKIGLKDSFYSIKINGEKVKKSAYMETHKDAVKLLIQELLDNKVIESLDEIDGVGHRVLHAADKFIDSVIVTDDVISAIEECIPLGPLHNPANLTGINAFMESLKGTPNVAVFDTAFHQTMPEKNYLYSVPYEWYEKYKIRKYGFHGTSYKYITKVMKEKLGKDNPNLIIAHLGSGASLCCVKDGVCYDTSMGITPNAGIMMGTRCGDIDYSIIDFYMRQSGNDLKEVDRILNKESGLVGICGYSDARDVENEINNGNEKAILAYEMYEDRIASFIAKYYVELEGNVDAIVFTAGVGENGFAFREQVINKLACLGLKVNKEVNDSIASFKSVHEGKISSEDSSIDIYVVPTNEELMIATDTYELIS